MEHLGRDLTYLKNNYKKHVIFGGVFFYFCYLCAQKLIINYYKNEKNYFYFNDIAGHGLYC